MPSVADDPELAGRVMPSAADDPELVGRVLQVISLEEVWHAIESERENHKDIFESLLETFSKRVQETMVAELANAMRSDMPKVLSKWLGDSTRHKPGDKSSPTLQSLESPRYSPVHPLQAPSSGSFLVRGNITDGGLPTSPVVTNASTLSHTGREQARRTLVTHPSSSEMGTADLENLSKASKIASKLSIKSIVTDPISKMESNRAMSQRVAQSSSDWSGIPKFRYSNNVGRLSQNRITSSTKRGSILEASMQIQTLNHLRTRAIQEESRMHKASYKVIVHRCFDTCCALMIFGNSLLIGYSTQYDIHFDKASFAVEAIGSFFSLFFLLEMLLRLDAAGVLTYFLGPDCWWNWFDFTLVMLSIVDFAVSLFDPSSELGGLKTIKMLRIMRVFRIFRFFSELSLLTILILHSVKSLVWALVLITLIVYVFAIVLTQFATNSHKPLVRKYFGSLDFTAYYLVCTMLGGISWVEISDVAVDMGAIISTLFFFYVAFMLLAVVNIINAVFVDNAIQTTKTERDLMIQREMDTKHGFVNDLINVFNEVDVDHSGEISWLELQAKFTDERVQIYFDALGLSSNDLGRLWELLDESQAGSVGLEEFVEGCVRFRGWARSIDMHFVLLRCKKLEEGMKKLLKAFRCSGIITRETTEHSGIGDLPDEVES